MECLLQIMDPAVATRIKPILLSISIILPLISLVVGLFFFLKAALIIEMQKRSYEKLNWKIEPISVEKEIGHLKIMGLFLIALAILATNYIVIKFVT